MRSNLHYYRERKGRKEVEGRSKLKEGGRKEDVMAGRIRGPRVCVPGVSYNIGMQTYVSVGDGARRVGTFVMAMLVFPTVVRACLFWAARRTCKCEVMQACNPTLNTGNEVMAYCEG